MIKQFPILCCTALVLFMSVYASADESHPGLAQESLYSEAVVAYNQKESQKALEILDKILTTQPDYSSALELKALALKDVGKDRAAVDVYLKLIKQKSEAERGPYYFEIGVILNRMGNKPTARAYFERSLSLNFNVSACQLFLGMIRFGANDPNGAEPYFKEVTKNGLPEMKLVAHYYLGMIYLKKGYFSAGMAEFEETRLAAKALPDNQTAKDTLAATEKVLAPFTTGQWFGNVTFLLQYDSNISEVPPGTAAQNAPSQSGTSQAVISGGLGYVSPALSTLQWVPSYQFSYNQNFNSATKGDEYFSNVGSVYLNYKPLSQFSDGLKLEGDFIFQNEPTDPTNLNGSYVLTKYAVTEDIGPYFKYQFSPQVRGELELDFRPQNFYTETDLSGNSYLARLSLKQDTSSRWFNPAGSLYFENDLTTSDSFKYKSVGLGVWDVMHATGRDLFTLSLDYIQYDYYASSVSRTDKTLNPHLIWVHTMNEKWSLLGQVSYTTNTSTIADTYSYNRFVAGFGVSRAL